MEYGRIHTHRRQLLYFAGVLASGIIASYLAGLLPTPKARSLTELEQPTFHEKVEKVVTFSLGERGMSSSYSLSDLEKKPREPFELRGYKPFRMYVENGKLYVDVSVYGGANLPPVEIERNQFTRYMPAQWDINFKYKSAGSC
jgi:hypothetical protein